MNPTRPRCVSGPGPRHTAPPGPRHTAPPGPRGQSGEGRAAGPGKRRRQAVRSGQAAGSRGRSGYRRRPAHLWATSANCARWKSAARRRISSQAAAIAASPSHVSPRRAGYGQRAGTNLLALAADRSAACRAGAPLALPGLAAATVIKKKKNQNKTNKPRKKRFPHAGLTPAAGDRWT